VPQNYGVPKHPLFCLKGCIKKTSKKAYKEIFGSDFIEEQD
jgi:hypothetical protein